MRLRTRKASHRPVAPGLSQCAQCGAKTTPHRVCPSCGYYKGRQVTTVSTA